MNKYISLNISTLFSYTVVYSFISLSILLLTSLYQFIYPYDAYRPILAMGSIFLTVILFVVVALLQFIVVSIRKKRNSVNILLYKPLLIATLSTQFFFYFTYLQDHTSETVGTVLLALSLIYVVLLLLSLFVVKSDPNPALKNMDISGLNPITTTSEGIWKIETKGQLIFITILVTFIVVFLLSFFIDPYK